MRFVRIPLDRVAVLIGPRGKTRRRIEQATKIPLFIDSDLGEVTFEDKVTADPLMIFKMENIILAIGRGFSPEDALLLLNDDMDFLRFDIHDYVGNKKSHVRRLKGRIIGTQGKTKRVIEELTESHISVYGHTISVIAHIDDIDIVKKAIDKLLTGSKHATVYRYIEQNMKKLRLQQGF